MNVFQGSLTKPRHRDNLIEVNISMIFFRFGHRDHLIIIKESLWIWCQKLPRYRKRIVHSR